MLSVHVHNEEPASMEFEVAFDETTKDIPISKTPKKRVKGAVRSKKNEVEVESDPMGEKI